MTKLLQQTGTVFAAGCAGGLSNSIAVWLAGKYGLTLALGVRIAPGLTPDWLYPRIVWGGLWGLLFLLPLLRHRWFLQGLVLSLGPTLVQLFVVFPHMAHKGMMGMSLGQLTPVFVILFNAVWGLTAAIWIRLCERA